jgi:hypothetical protein
MSRKFTKKPADHCGAGFWVIFRDIYTTVTSILKVEGPFQFWLITQSILNGFGWFLAQKNQKNRGNNATKSEIQKPAGNPPSCPRPWEG